MTIPLTENIIQQIMVNNYSGNDFIVYKVANRTSTHIEIIDYETTYNRQN